MNVESEDNLEQTYSVVTMVIKEKSMSSSTVFLNFKVRFHSVAVITPDSDLIGISGNLSSNLGET